MSGETVYCEGGITVIRGDSREVLAELGDSVGVMVTDPPYGYGYASNMPWRWGGGKHEIANDRDTSARDGVLDVWGNRPALAFGSWKRPRPEATREVLVWDKGPEPNMGALELPWAATYEEIYVLGRGWVVPDGIKRGACVIRIAPRRHHRTHPNEKPVALMRHLIERCPPGVIVDPFMGSGSTLVAARELGREAIGIEVEERWCRVAVDRLAQAPLFAMGGE